MPYVRPVCCLCIDCIGGALRQNSITQSGAAGCCCNMCVQTHLTRYEASAAVVAACCWPGQQRCSSSSRPQHESSYHSSASLLALYALASVLCCWSAAGLQGQCNRDTRRFVFPPPMGCDKANRLVSIIALACRPAPLQQQRIPLTCCSWTLPLSHVWILN
jgi:hypothetical protein